MFAACGGPGPVAVVPAAALGALVSVPAAALTFVGLYAVGGAVPIPHELVAETSQPVSPWKQAIARAAAACIREHARILVDSGSTTAALIPELDRRPGLVVMTNSLEVANALRELLTRNEVRWMCSFDTTEADVDAFAALIRDACVRGGSV